MADVARLLEIMARLRDPRGGCPWDLEQDFASIAPYTIEEAYEVDDAIRRGDFEGLRDELGDLLLQVVFHAQMAGEAARFDFGDVVDAICDKLVRRHPHVFGDAVVETAAAQTQAWEEHKARERAEAGNGGALQGVPLALPALERAAKLQSRAARAGLAGGSAADAFDALGRRFGELAREIQRGDAPPRRAEALGELLFAAAELARQLELSPETLLRDANARFEARVRESEASYEMVREIAVKADRPGLHEITREVEQVVAAARIAEGLCTVFVRHTSASLVVQENADPSARRDLEHWLDRLVPERDPLYTHTTEGADDMPAHVKAALTATSLSIPVLGGRLALGTWQGIFLWEHRRRGGERRLAIHVGA